jgi:hypothetical protein
MSDHIFDYTKTIKVIKSLAARKYSINFDIFLFDSYFSSFITMSVSSSNFVFSYIHVSQVNQRKKHINQSNVYHNNKKTVM